MNVAWPLACPSRLVVAGDWHGNDRAAKNALEAARAVGAALVLQLGDFGVWPGPEGSSYLDRVDDLASHYKIPVAFIDGNHEDFGQIYGLDVNPKTGLRHMRENVWHIPRASSWEWLGVRFRALGGATSLDRLSRTPGKSWWPEEALTEQDLARALDGGTCDVLLTHDCPSGVSIPGIEHRNYSAALTSGWPLSELERAWDHRDLLADIVRELSPRHLWHGHFHDRYSSLARLGNACEIAIEGLADDGAGPHRNLMVVDIGADAVQVKSLESALADLAP